MLLAVIGLACIYAGYVLFCGLPSARWGRSKLRLLALNILPGAVLASIGVGVIMFQVKSVVTPHRVVRARPAGLLQARRPADT
ncbi:MAG TPA: hypothetical protein VHC90_12680 [Bryobacteraceae bacterium]|nr:hypothetical protein [Bryobacteraceae bacterium]